MVLLSRDAAAYDMVAGPGDRAAPLEWATAGLLLMLGTFLAHVAVTHAAVIEAGAPHVSDLLALQARFAAGAAVGPSGAFSYYVALGWIGTAGLLLLVAALVTFFPLHYRVSGRRLADIGLVMALLLALVAQVADRPNAWASGVHQAAGTGLSEVGLLASADWATAVAATGYLPIGAAAAAGLLLMRAVAMLHPGPSPA